MDASLCFVQHDKTEGVNPSASEESIMDASLRLRFAQHDKTKSVISNAVRNPAHGCFAALSMTRPVMPSTPFRRSELSFLSFRARARNPLWMLHFASLCSA